MPFVRLKVHDGRRVLVRVIRRDGDDETAGIPAAGRHRRPHGKSVELAETGEGTVRRQLPDTYLLHRLPGRHRQDGTPFATRIVILHRDGQRPVSGTFRLHPGGTRFDRPLRRRSLHVDFERLIALRQERTEILSDFHILHLLAATGRAGSKRHAGQQRQHAACIKSLRHK